MSAFTKKNFEKLRMIEIDPRGCWKRSSIFQTLHLKRFELVKENLTCQVFHRKRIQKVLIKIEEMVEVFLNSANFAKHTFSTLASPSGYALNLKALIKLTEHLSFYDGNNWFKVTFIRIDNFHRFFILVAELRAKLSYCDSLCSSCGTFI